MIFRKLINAFASTRHLNGTILVASEDRIDSCCHFGYSDIQNKLEITDKTQFLAASVTKQFTAAAILRALREQQNSEEQTLKSLHNPISTFLSKDHEIWEGEMPDWADVVTIHHLLSHSSGIPNYTSLPEFGTCEANSPKVIDIVRLFRNMTLEFKSGSQFAYSNSGYLLLGEIIPQITGLQLGEYLDKTFFNPLNMTATTYATQGMVQDLRVSDPRFKNLALGYTFDGSTPEAKLQEIESYTPMQVPGGGGSLVSSAHDLLKWNVALHGGQVLPDFLYNALIKKQMRHIPDPWNRLGTHYGYGIAINESDSVGDYYVHHGGIKGFRSALIYLPQDKVSIVLLTNVEEPQNQEAENDCYNILGFEPFFMNHFRS